MSRARAISLRFSSILLTATIVLGLAGHLLGTGTGTSTGTRMGMGTGLGAGLGTGFGTGTVPVAYAGDEWSDGDPIRLIQTEDGRLLPVAIFYTPGAQVRSLLDLSRILSLLSGTLLSVHSTSEPAPGGTRVSLRVTVPTGLGAPFPTRLVVSSGPYGTLTRYSEVYGTIGWPLVP
jgi:hypothetical protein